MFVYKETARLCSRPVMTDFPGIRDLNCCWFVDNLWYIFSLKRKGTRDFKCLHFWILVLELFPLLFNKSYEDF